MELELIESQERRMPAFPKRTKFIMSKNGLKIERLSLVCCYAISRISLFIELNGEKATMPLISTAGLSAETFDTL